MSDTIKPVDPRLIGDLLLSAPGIWRATEAMSQADRAALICAGKAVWDAAVEAERERCAQIVEHAYATMLGITPPAPTP